MGTEFSNIESWGIINMFYSRIFGIYNICANRVGVEAWEEKRSILAAETSQMTSTEDADQSIQEQSFRFWGGAGLKRLRKGFFCVMESVMGTGKKGPICILDKLS